MCWHFISGGVILPEIRETLWPCSVVVFSHLFCLLLVGLWEASRRAVEPGWIRELPAHLQHGTIPWVSARSGLPSCYFLTSAPLRAATFQRAHVLQHKLPSRRPSCSVHVPQGAICVTCYITLQKATWYCHSNYMGKQNSAWQICIHPDLASVNSISLKCVSASLFHDKILCNLWSSVPCVLCTACSTEAVCRTSLTLWCKRSRHQIPSFTTPPYTLYMCPLTLIVFDCFLTFEYFCQPSEPCTEYVIVSLKMFFSFFYIFYITHSSSDLLYWLLLFVFCLSVSHMLASLKVIYYTVCVIGCVLVKKIRKKYKCHLNCEANYQSIMTWTTPLIS